MTPFAVTLHPFDEHDATATVLPAAIRRDPLLPGSFEHPGAREFAARWLPRMHDAWEALREGDGGAWSSTVHFALGVLSGFAHPAYFLGDFGLSYWRGAGEAPLRSYTRSMAVLAARVPELGAAVSEIPDGFAGAGSAGAFIPSSGVVLLLRDIERRATRFSESMARAGHDPEELLSTVLEALHYARERRLALLEVTNAVDPRDGLSLFPIAHLRGGWRGGLMPELRARVVRSIASGST